MPPEAMQPRSKAARAAIPKNQK